MNANQLSSFDSFRDAVHAWTETLHDDYAHTKEICFKANGSLGDLSFESEAIGALFGKTGVVANRGMIGPRAFTQICQRYHIPGDWAKNKKYCEDALLEMVVNWKLQNEDDARVMLRQRSAPDGNIVRAVLSDDYVRYDHSAIIDAVYAILKQEAISARVFRPVIDDTLRVYILVGDGFFGGGPDTQDGGLRPAVHIENDETGGGTVRIEGALWRQTCSNGSIAYTPEGERTRIFHRWNTPSLLASRVNEALAVAFKLSEASAVKFLEKQQEFIPLTSLKSIVKSWSDKYYLGDSFQKEWEGVATAQADGPSVSMFNVINGATALARSIESSDVQTSVERMAGEMIFTAPVPAYR